MSFSVHNAYLHMTNVNTTEDKRITPPPVIMILALYCCVVRKSACMRGCVSICMCHVFVQIDVHVCASACVWEKEQRLHLVRATECASMKHFCHSQVPFWSSLEVEWGQAESGEGSHLRPPLTQGAPSWSHSLLYSWVVPLSPVGTHTLIWCVMIPLSYFHLHSSPIQYSVIKRATKRVKTQADFGDKLPGIRGLYPGSSWEEAGGAKAKVTS